MVSELSLDKICPIYWQKYRQNRPEMRFRLFLACFSAKKRSSIIQAHLCDHIWNPLIKPNLLHPQYESGIDFFLLASHSIIKKNSLVRGPKKKFYGRK